jgi:TPR repeat protein
MRRRFTATATLAFFLLLSGPAGAGFGFHCDEKSGAVVLSGQPATAHDQYLAAKAYNGYCKTADRKQAEAWYLKAAAQGHKDAQHELGELYFTGHGIPVNYPEARKWHLKAAEQGEARSQLRLGFLYAEKHFEGVTADLVEAEKWFLKAAEQDVKDARFRLGNFYVNYKEPPDLAQGRKWLQLAAEGGHRTAMYDLGRLLLRQDAAQQGVEWITKAAEANEMQAQITLAEIYEAGRVVAKNEDEVVKWVLRVTLQPNCPVHYFSKAGDVMYYGAGSTLRNYPSARRFYERAAAKGDARALRMLATIYREGRGVKKDEARADKYDRRALWYERNGPRP